MNVNILKLHRILSTDYRFLNDHFIIFLSKNRFFIIFLKNWLFTVTVVVISKNFYKIKFWNILKLLANTQIYWIKDEFLFVYDFFHKIRITEITSCFPIFHHSNNTTLILGLRLFEWKIITSITVTSWIAENLGFQFYLISSSTFAPLLRLYVYPTLFQFWLLTVFDFSIFSILQ